MFYELDVSPGELDASPGAGERTYNITLGEAHTFLLYSYLAPTPPSSIT
jgi:hypothetical protein